KMTSGAMGPLIDEQRSLIDLRTERAIGRTNSSYCEFRHVPGRKTIVALSWPSSPRYYLSWPSPRYIPIPDAPLDAEVAQLFAEVVTCHELDPDGTSRPLDEATWEERRGKLAQRVREHSAPLPVGRVAADPWHWLRRKLGSAKTDDERIKYLD